MLALSQTVSTYFGVAETEESRKARSTYSELGILVVRARALVWIVAFSLPAKVADDAFEWGAVWVVEAGNYAQAYFALWGIFWVVMFTGAAGLFGELSMSCFGILGRGWCRWN